MNKPTVPFSLLAQLITDGDITTLRSCLSNKNCSANECDENGQTLLMIAAQQGNVTVVNELLAHGADVNAEDGDNWSALTNAAKCGSKDVVIKLLDHGADKEHKDMGQWTPLMWACYKGHYYIVKILLDHDVMVNVVDKNHCTPLLWAAGRGYLEIVEALLERGAKVYSSDKYGTTPLVWACRKGYTEIVPLLLDAGANVDTAGMFSWTPLLVATKGNFASIVNMLLEHKPNVNAVDMDGCTALSIACKEGYTEITKALMSGGAYINLPDRNGDTNLIHASKSGHFSIVDALIRKYADIDLAGGDGKTALYWAVEKGYADIVRLLLAANPSTEIATKDGDTALLKATRSRNAEIVQMLVDKKCKVSAADKKGDTALHIAMRARSKAIVEVLLRNPKNSQLLYRPNKAGETPYNIDTNHQKSILAHIFGARRLNTNEDSENRLGYDLYSSSLADILSEPSLSMPISVGLYAKWGSGKSFLIRKLENEMRNFAMQYIEPVFTFEPIVHLMNLLLALSLGALFILCTEMWVVGGYVAIGVFVTAFAFFVGIIYLNYLYDNLKLYKFSLYLARKCKELQTLMYVMFCSPPANKAANQLDPVRFVFAEKTKVSSSGTDISVLQIITSLNIAVEKEYGLLTSRIYRVLKPKPVASQWWKFRRVCCIPNFIVALLFMFGVGIILLLGFRTDAAQFGTEMDDRMVVLRWVLVSALFLVAFLLTINLYTFIQFLKTVISSHHRRITGSYMKMASPKDDGCISSLKKEVDTVAQMVQCLDSFIGKQTRLVVIVDGLDSCEQDKVLYILDAVHTLFSDTNAPFITVLAIDPHIVIKAIESNIHKAFQKSDISGYEYLRNVVHLPFYLQNSGLRRVKAAQQAALLGNKKSSNYWNEDKECEKAAPSISSNRKTSNSSMSIPDAIRKRSKGTQKLKPSDSIASSMSNLHRMVTGAQDLNKVLLTDDYFSDINPKSMRRLMNIVYLTGRLLKAFNIDFNWYHLASWVNISEQWPYRTSWLIMYYEMHETEFDEMLPLKTIYEKIRHFMPTSKEQEPILDLDHDERKFEVFLSIHSSNLLVNDLKVFLPFTISLDPYIRKLIQETHQQVSEFLKVDLKPSSPPAKYDALHLKLQQMSAAHHHNNTHFGAMNYGNPLPKKDTHPMAQMHPMPNYGSAPPPPWWGPPPSDTLHPAFYASSKAATLLSPDQEKLSTLSVNGICDLLKSQDKLNKKKLESYLSSIEDNNINGQVLLTCDLKELKDTLMMSFGDWELFRILILNLRQHEMDNINTMASAPNMPSSSNLEDKAPSRTTSFKGKPNLSAKPPKSPDKKNIEVSKSRSDSTDGNVATKQRSSSLLEKQVTMEESMIVGALETLNEEAIEDTMQDNGFTRKPSIVVLGGNPLSPILSDTEEQCSMDKGDGDQAPLAASSQEIDVLYLRSLQGSPMLRVSAISLSDSMTDAETLSLGRSQNITAIIEPPPSRISRTKSEDFDSSSSTSSPSKKRTDIKTSSATQRPSSLAYDSANYVLIPTSKTGDKPPKPVSLSDRKSAEKSSNTFSNVTNKIKHLRKKSLSRSESSDTSTETEEKTVRQPLKSNAPPIQTPVSDGFYSDDEHTPLVSPSHLNRYNLQSSKPEKDSTPEKCIPKQKLESGPHMNIRKSALERQYSVDSNLCDHAKPLPSSTSLVEICKPSTVQYVPVLSAYGQVVVDTPSPEKVQSLEMIHNETVL